MGFTSANSVKPPGVKDPDPMFKDEKGLDVDCNHAVLADEALEITHDYIQALSSKDERREAFDSEKKVSFKEEVEHVDVPNYNDYYGIQP